MPAFVQFQAIVLTLVNRLESAPIATITGHKKLDPAHELDQRGFRFFFSPSPAGLYQRILESLRLKIQLSAEGSARYEAALRYQELKFCPDAQGKTIGHSILEDIKFMAFF